MESKSENETRQAQPKTTEGMRLNPVALILSAVAFAGGVLIIVGGGQLLSIRTPGLRAVGAIGDTYYHGLGLAFVGFGVIVAATSLWSCFRSLGGRWRRRQ